MGGADRVEEPELAPPVAIVRMLYANHGLDGAWDASSQVPTLPACHLGDANRQKAWRSTGAGTSDFARVNVCSTALGVDRVAWVSANFTTCAFLGVEGDCTSAFASASLFTTCFAPWHAGRSGVVFADLSARQTKKWWRFVVCDTGVDDGYYQVGVFALGLAACMRIDVHQDGVRYAVVDPSLVEYAPAGTPKTWTLPPYAVVELPHRFLAEALVFDTGGGLQDINRSGGRRADMVLSVYSSAPACSCAALALNLYGRFEANPEFSYAYAGGLTWDATVRFRESL